MALFRSRSRYGRLIALAAILAGLYHLSSLAESVTKSSSSSSFFISLRRPQLSNPDESPNFSDPDRPRAKMPAQPLPKKPHKTANGRPNKLSRPADTNSRGPSPAQPSPAPAPEESQSLPPPPPGLHLPGGATAAADDPLERQFSGWEGPGSEPVAARPRPARKEPSPPDPDSAGGGGGGEVPDPFPLLSREEGPAAVGAALERLGAVPGGGGGKEGEGRERRTPLLIGFTRNWPLLLQCVVGYLAAGWPARDVWVVENTGTMRANREGRLGLQNPFYLNHTQLGVLGVNVLVTPTLLTFAQLQNFYAWTALERNWTEYFWSHQDLLVFSFENATTTDRNETLHARAAAIMAYLGRPGVPRWANHFFAYDHLTLVHRDAVLDVGGWDTHIPYYATDCDMYNRLMWAGYWQGETQVGIILDVASVLDDVGALLRLPGIHAAFQGDPGPEADGEEKGEKEQDRAVADVRDGQKKVAGKQEKTAPRKADTTGKHVATHGETWARLVEVGRRMERAKYADGGGRRNEWQLRQTGGRGEPFYRDPDGFETGLRMAIDAGRAVFAEKWGHRGCDIAQIGLGPEDAWRVERDWDPETEGGGSEGDGW